jgi:predicted membrane metal-binding protein
MARAGAPADIAATDSHHVGELKRAISPAMLVLRRRHFAVPSWVPGLGAVTCLALMTQFKAGIYLRAVILVALGLALCGINFLVTRRLETRPVPREFT